MEISIIKNRGHALSKEFGFSKYVVKSLSTVKFRCSASITIALYLNKIAESQISAQKRTEQIMCESNYVMKPKFLGIGFLVS